MMVNLVKQLQCVRYQCSEGEVPSEKVYKELSELIGDLCEDIISRNEVYDAFPWELETDEQIKAKIASRKAV